MFEDNTDPEALVLDSLITDREISEAIMHLKNGKSAGMDHPVVEMFKSSQSLIMPFLNKCFNRLLETGIFPTSWSKSIIIPIPTQMTKEVFLS